MNGLLNMMYITDFEGPHWFRGRYSSSPAKMNLREITA